MKKCVWLVLPLLMTSCFSGGGGGGGTNAEPSEPEWTSYSVETATSLPTCSGSIVGRLYYVEDEQEFRVCRSSGWATITLGNTILSNRLVGSSTNLCTGATGISCSFGGGQLIEYSDGSVLVNGRWYFGYSNGGELDTDSVRHTIIFPSGANENYLSLGVGVRGGTVGSVYMVYTRSPESVKIVFDTDDDGIPEGTDETLSTPALTSW